MSTCLVAQSGGPTAVINASLAGVIRANQLNPLYDRVLGGIHGIEGVLADQLYDLTDLSEHDLELLRQTPSSALGTCRYKLKRDDEADFRRLADVMDAHDIETMFYIGGNDSMDTCAKISRYMAKVGYECRVIGVPKTIDNDLIGTDHCPGFASAAKYIAASVMEVARDCRVYNKGMITIIECMGRHAGWLTAATVLPAAKGDGPDLIYLPEVDFDMADFLDDVIRVYEGQGQCLVAVSEGIHYSDGAFVSEAKTSSTDGFGHAQLGGLAALLAESVKRALGVKVRGIELSLLQRCGSHLASLTDVREAYLAGKAAVEAATAGLTDQMVALDCTRDASGYRCQTKLIPLTQAANTERKVPLDWITPEGNGIRQPFIDYALPLIQGELQRPLAHGLPQFAKLKKILTSD